MEGTDVMSMVQVPMRIPGRDWEDFHAVHGREAAAGVRGFIAWSLHRPGAAEPARPGAAALPKRDLVPAAAVEQFTAWYLRQPGARLPSRPRGETPGTTIRLDSTDWKDFQALHGGKATEAVKQFIAWSLHRPGAQLPVRLPPPDGDD